MNVFRQLVTVVLVTAAACGWAQQTDASSSQAGYSTAVGYRNSANLVREAWVQGFIDGVLVTNYLATPRGNVDWLRSCIRGMKADQIAAIFAKYIEDHPEEWHKPMSLSAHAALRTTCKQ